MTDAGYYTAFLGKYVNSMECDAVSGFNHWGGLTCGNFRGQPYGGTYNFMNAVSRPFFWCRKILPPFCCSHLLQTFFSPLATYLVPMAR